MRHKIAASSSASQLCEEVYEVFEARYAVTKFECDLIEKRLSTLRWDEFIDDDTTRYIWEKILAVDMS